MGNKLDTVSLDYDRICEELAKRKKSKTWLSIEIGKSRSYFTNLPGSRRGTNVPTNVESLISRVLGHEPGTFVKKEPAQNAQDNIAAQAKLFEKLYETQTDIIIRLDMMAKRLDEIEKYTLHTSRRDTLEKKRHEEVMDHLEFIRSKSNANTLQLEKTKDALIAMDNGSLDNQEQLVDEIAKAVAGLLLKEHIVSPEELTRSEACKLLEELITGRNGMEQQEVFVAAAEKNIPRKDLLRAKNEMGIQVISRGVGKNSKKYWCKGY